MNQILIFWLMQYSLTNNLLKMNRDLTKKMGASLRAPGFFLPLFFLLLSVFSAPSSLYADSGAVACDANAGTLIAISNDCLEGDATLVATIQNQPVVPAGYQVLYVLTSGTGLVIEQVNAAPTFNVTEEGLFTIHTLVYDPTTLDLSIVVPGVTTGFDVNSLLEQGGGSICASLDVAGAQFNVIDCACGSDAGTMVPISSTCDAGIATLVAATGNNPIVPPGFSLLYVLTQGDDLVIIDAGAEPTFNVSEPGEYRIHALVFDPNSPLLNIVQFGETTGVEVNALLTIPAYGICGDLDVPGAFFDVAPCPCDADAGVLLSTSHDCLTDELELSAQIHVAPTVPAGFEVLYVLTSSSDLVIIGVNTEPVFTVTDEGSYRIHTLVYNPNTLDLSIVEPGVTTGFDVNGLLIQGGGDICASLDVAGAQYTVNECICAADAGTLAAASDNCLSGSADLVAEIDMAPSIPDNYSLIYVLTSGSDLVIQNVNSDPSFTVTETGTYTIHTLVYDPNTLDLGIVEIGVTTGFDVNGLLIQGGGSICASLDVAGAAFEVTECPCDATAGTLNGSGLCFQDDQALISAQAAGDAVVPAGYEVLYVLTSTDDLIIQNVNATPEFEVEAVGSYTIHTLVYDPNTLDLSIVEIGVTTGFDVNGLLVQGGGSICAALDVTGASFSFGGCDFACLAEAGSLVPDSDNCLDGSADLVAAVATAPGVPAGFEVLYVLTSGSGLVIEQVNAAPEFTVEMEGLYTIHTLVYDPNTLDLSIVEPGVTTGFDVNGLLEQGGGDICAALDVAGAAFEVATCPCTADAGTLTAVSDNCLEDNVAELVAETADAPVVPTGYEVLYVLTSGSGLVIEQVNADPVFTVEAVGTYTIHTLVYNPATLDLSIVEPGVTTGFDVNGLLQQGGGDICASLLVAGATYEVVECPSIQARPFPNPVDDMLNIRFSENAIGQSVIVRISDQSGVMMKQVILEGVNEVESFTVNDLPTGSYSIVISKESGEVITTKTIMKM
jgi:hypothetical protein